MLPGCCRPQVAGSAAHRQGEKVLQDGQEQLAQAVRLPEVLQQCLSLGHQGLPHRFLHDRGPFCSQRTKSSCV